MKRWIFLLPFLLVSCAPKIVYVNTETVRVEVQTLHDTTIAIQLVPIRDSVSIRDTISLLSNKYAYSSASWSKGLLNHSLAIKDVSIPVQIKYVNTETHDTSRVVVTMPISKQDQAKIDNYDKVKESASSRLATIWKLIALLSLSIVVIFRKPLFTLIKKVIKPV